MFCCVSNVPGRRWPNLILLWQALAVLPLSTVECERGFSRQNIIKSWVRGALCNARLGELMQISLLKYEIEWPEALEVWRSMRRRRPVKSLKLAMAERERKGKQKEGEAVAAGTAGENEDEGEEEEEDDEVEQDLGDDQEVVEEEDNSFLSDDEDVEEVYFIDKPVLQRFGFQFSSPQPTPLSTSHSLSAPPSDESVEPSGPCPELVGCLMYLMTCTRPDLAYPLSLLARYVAHGRHRKVDDSATQRSSQGYTFSLGSGSVSWRSTRSSSVLSSSCEAEIYAGVMAAQELRWLTYLLTDLGEQPRSPPVLYVDNKAMIALCQEHRLEHRMKHIALRYFLARELQQRGQLRLAYVATRANTAYIFTKALPPCDHHRFSTVLGLVPTLPHLLTA
ncbi:unnamed protein product [Closterium sp. NIES-54]